MKATILPLRMQRAARIATAHSLCLFVFFSLISGSCYSLKQAYWFNNSFNRRLPTEKALLQVDLDESNRKKIELSQTVLAFANEQGLNTGDAYRYYIPRGPGTVSYLVQAAYDDRLELKSWWFPIIGRVPYLGFYEKSDRNAKAEELRRQGFDVSLGTVEAFSSLGWFADPLYEDMFKSTDEDFIQVLLHELIHRSFWSRGSVSFNENLAEFASFHLTEVFLKEQRGGVGLSELRSHLAEKERLRQWLSELREALGLLYKRVDIGREEKMLKKSAIIQNFRKQRFPILKSPSLAAAKDREWNNAMILSASLYSPNMERFRRSFACVKSDKMGKFLAALEEQESLVKDVEQALEGLCNQVIVP